MDYTVEMWWMGGTTPSYPPEAESGELTTYLHRARRMTWEEADAFANRILIRCQDIIVTCEVIELPSST